MVYLLLRELLLFSDVLRGDFDLWESGRGLRIGGGILFLAVLYGMFYFGYRTFYIEQESFEHQTYDYHFALISEELDNDYWRLVEEGAVRAADALNVYLEYVGPPKADNEQLLKWLDRMIAMKVDGIIVQGVQGDQFKDLVFKAVENGIPIVTIDTDVKNSLRHAYVGTNNYDAGKLAGETFIANSTGKQFVGIITGRFDAINQQERLLGFKDAIKSVARIQIVGEKESNITQSGAAQATYALLKEHSSITALVGMSALDGIGIVDGLNEFTPNKEVYVSAFDLLPGTIDLINQGEIDVTIAQYPVEMGYQSVQVLTQLQNKESGNREIYTSTGIITKDSRQTYDENH